MEFLQLNKKLWYLYGALPVIVLLLILIFVKLWTSKEHEPEMRDFAQIRAEGTLKVVTNYNRLNYYLSGDTIEGVQYELIKQLGSYFGWETKIFIENDLQKSFDGLKSGKYDIVARNIPVTTELRELYAFTDPVELSKQVLIQNKNSENPPLRNQLGLAGETLYVNTNSPVKLRIRNLEEEIGDTIHVVESPYDTEQLIMMVAHGEIKYAVGDLETVQLLAPRFKNIDYSTDITFTQLQSWALRKTSPDLLDSVNMWLQTVGK